MNNKNFKKQEATKLARLFDKGYLKETGHCPKFCVNGNRIQCKFVLISGFCFQK